MLSADFTYSAGPVSLRYSETFGAGPHTFVLVHGIGMGRVVFAEVAEVLARSGRVLTVDLPGFGDSPEPGTAHSLQRTAEVVATFVTEMCRGPVVLIGHSMGTQIVAEVAVRHPELVSHLVLIAPTVNRYERRAGTQALRMVQDLWGEGPKVLGLGVWQYAKTSPKWFLNKLRFMLQHHLEALCPAITQPTLVLRGETDRVCPRGWVSEVAAAIPHSTMSEIPGRGHEAIIRSPEPVGSMVLDFVTNSSSVD